MTLTEARKILEEYHPHEIRVRQALDVAISVLPKESKRQSVEDRFSFICDAIESANGRTPFDTRIRDKESVCWRQCVWKKLKQEGYPNLAIARTTGWDHATVWWGLDRLSDYLQSGDPLAVATWQELNNILNDGTKD